MSQSVIEPLPAIAAAKVQGSVSGRAWLWLNFASLDAPLVALLWQLLLQRCLNIAATFETSAALAVSVWFIYVSDRLLDALRGRSDALAPRHEFYRRHWHAFAATAMVGLFALGWLCARINPSLLRKGFILLGGVVAYLWSYTWARRASESFGRKKLWLDSFSAWVRASRRGRRNRMGAVKFWLQLCYLPRSAC